MKLNIPIRSKTFLSYLASFLSVVLLPLLALWVMLRSTLNHSVQEQFLSYYESQILRSVSEQIDVNISYSIYVS